VERRWVRADRDLDLAVIEDILAGGYRQIQPDGTVIEKNQAVASYAARKFAGKLH